MPLLAILTPGIKILVSGLAVIIVDIFRRKTNVEKKDISLKTATEAVNQIDRVVINTVQYVEQYKKDGSITKENSFNTAQRIVKNTLSDYIRKEAEKIVVDVDSYINKKIESEVLKLKPFNK